MKYKYTCTRCRDDFELDEEMADKSDMGVTPALVCTPCFKYIIAATSADQYYRRKAKTYN